MPLPVPNLDDRTFEQLVTEGRSLIPRYSPEWTNHNPSDPGITLLELFAYLVETAIFRLNQVPEASIEHFLKLIDVCREGTAGEREAIDQALERAVQALERQHRAITVTDFELLAREAAEQAGTRLGRTAFVLHRDEACGPAQHPEQAPLVALVLVVPDEPSQLRPMPTPELITVIFRELTQHRLLTTRLQVVGPQYVEVEVEVRLVRRRGSGLTPGGVEQAIRAFLDPLRGGPTRQGWPFGRAVYYSEMFQVLEGLAGVDHVEELRLSEPGAPPSEGEGIAIPAHALVVPGEIRVTVVEESAR